MCKSSEQDFDSLNFDNHWQLETRAVRQAALRSAQREHSDPIYLTSSFVFNNAKQAEALFAGQESGNVYSRFSNPNTTALAQRLASLEGAKHGLVTASGMSAIMSICLALLEQGSEVVCAKELFGTSVGLFRDLLHKFGVKVHFVSLTNYAEWQQKINTKTRFLFCETPSNPLCQQVDLNRLSALAKQHDSLLIVDNCFATPALQRPMALGADIVIHSMTKFIDGGGRCLGGAVLCDDDQIQAAVFAILRTTGASLSPFNAWMLQKSLETLSIRMQQQSLSASKIAQWLNARAGVIRVHHPSLFEGQQRELVDKQMSGFGAIVSFEVANQAKAWQVIDGCRLFSITANLGDARSSICHPATTTHNRLGDELRQQVGISDGLIRLSIGLEATDDLCADLAKTLGS